MTKDENDKIKKLPPVGMRIIKSAIGVGLCFVIYLLRGRQGTPFYSALAVLWCIRSHPKDSVLNAFQRLTGTAIGAVYAILFILFELYVTDFGYGIFHYLVLSAFIVPVIYTTVLIHKGNASYFACVVYLSIVVNHITDGNPFVFVLNRSMDTVIGIVVALIINLLHFHGPGRKDILFVADFDNSMKMLNDTLTPYSRVMLQNLIDEGMMLTFMTLKTPAAYLETMREIIPDIPVIAMDGAILYDVKDNSYSCVHVISAEHAGKLEDRIHEEGFQLFTTVIIDDVLIIYYDEPQNEAAAKIYDQLHRSPYRNYLKKKRPDKHPVVYYMLIDVTERIDRLYEHLSDEGLFEGLKVMKYPSDDYQGYSYIKIYSKNASVEDMIDYLMIRMNVSEVVTVADHNSHYKVMYKEDNGNAIVNRLQKIYYSRKWK